MPTVIQFIHPGDQPPRALYANRRKLWNRGIHYRSFIQARGQATDGPDVPRRPEERLRFWGEWEAEADVVQEFPRSTRKADAKVCIQPRISTPASHEGHQNTDPFVFDGPFIYCVCRQEKRPSLQRLEPSDLILFGSNLDGGFVLDTVFVVASSEPYAPGKIVPASVPESFRRVTDWALSGGTHCWTGKELRLYRGATPEKRVLGMFSFAPALVPGSGRDSFRRPMLTPAGALEGCITPTLNIGIKTSLVSSTAEAWKAVVTQVLAESLSLGIAFFSD